MAVTGQNILEILKTQLQESLEKINNLQTQQSKALSSRQILDSQLNENKLVKEEMDALDTEAKVFKLIGPALVKQDVIEAQQNVDKRIAYITGEMKRQDDLINDIEKKQNEEKETFQTIQIQLQKLTQ